MIVALGVGTFATRLSFLALFARNEPPRRVRRALQYVPPAVLAAIIAPLLFTRPPVESLTPDAARTAAAIVAFLVAWVTRSTLLTIVVGMLVLWGARALVA